MQNHMLYVRHRAYQVCRTKKHGVLYTGRHWIVTVASKNLYAESILTIIYMYDNIMHK